MTVAVVHTEKVGKLENVLINGDLKSLSEPERVNYYMRLCESLGLNPLTKPFDYLPLNGKLTLYAKRDATDQLRSLRKVSVKIVARETINDIFTVTAQATLPDGRTDESIGAVNISALRGADLANTMMKTETKAKRRVTLSICGLGLLDETETEDIPEVKVKTQPAIQAKIPQARPVEKVEEKPVEKNGLIEMGEDYEGLSAYVVEGGRFKGQSLGEIDDKQLAAYLDYWKQRENAGLNLSPTMKAFLTKAEKYLASLE